MPTYNIVVFAGKSSTFLHPFLVFLSYRFYLFIKSLSILSYALARIYKGSILTIYPGDHCGPEVRFIPFASPECRNNYIRMTCLLTFFTFQGHKGGYQGMYIYYIQHCSSSPNVCFYLYTSAITLVWITILLSTWIHLLMYLRRSSKSLNLIVQMSSLISTNNFSEV